MREEVRKFQKLLFMILKISLNFFDEGQYQDLLSCFFAIIIRKRARERRAGVLTTFNGPNELDQKFEKSSSSFPVKSR